MNQAERPIGAAYLANVGDIQRDKEAVLSLWRGNLGNEANLSDKYDWFYRHNPEGHPLLVLLRHAPTGELVGVGAAGPRRLVIDEKVIFAGLFVDFAVSAHHRSLGPALILQKELITLAKRRFDFLYGFPNPKALPVFRRAGFEVIGHIERHAAILRHTEYLQRHLRRALSVPLGKALELATRSKLALDARHHRLGAFFQDRADERMASLWASSERSRTLEKARSLDFLRWRFDEKPSSNTRYLLVEDESAGHLEAFFACTAYGQSLQVLDFVSKDGASGGSAPIHALLRAALREGYCCVSVEFAGPSSLASSFKEAGFALRQTRPIVGLWTNRPPSPPPSLFFTAADEDE